MIQRKRSTSIADAIDDAARALPRDWVLIDAPITTEAAGFDAPPDADYVVAIAYRRGTDWRAHARPLLPAHVFGLGPDVEMALSSLGDPIEAFSDLAGYLRAR